MPPEVCRLIKQDIGEFPLSLLTFTEIIFPETWQPFYFLVHFVLLEPTPHPGPSIDIVEVDLVGVANPNCCAQLSTVTQEISAA